MPKKKEEKKIEVPEVKVPLAVVKQADSPLTLAQLEDRVLALESKMRGLLP